MDKIDRHARCVSERLPPAISPALLSRQVSGSRYFFLDLAPARRKPCLLVMGGLEHCDPDYLIDRPGYAYHLIEFVIEGRGTLTLAGKSHELGPGAVFAVSPDMACRMTCDQRAPMTKFFFAFAGRAPAARFAKAGLRAGVVRQLPVHAELRSAAEELLREGRRGTAFTPAVCEVLTELLLLRIAEAVAPSPAARRSRAQENFQHCRALIEAHAETTTTLEQIAALAGLDVSSICRLFRRFQGESPYQYLLRRKMTVAAELLLDRNCAVKEAAQHVGFADPLHFTRCFKAVHGVPPSRLHRVTSPVHRG